jgi:hypothetical protein
VKSLNKTGKSVVHQLYKNPQSRLKIIRFNNFEHALVLFTHAHDSNFINDDLPFILVFRFYKFESAQEPICLSFYFKNLCKATLAKFSNNVVKFTGVNGLNLAVLFHLRLELFFGRHLFDNVCLAVSFCVVHRDQTIYDICSAFINILLSVIDQISAEFVWETLQLCFTFTNRH